ncbi:MAG TPA: L-aspartate oxidase [Myxococcota bacterium]|nr:L-aspartate oxidase [Myxococcota bacterium]HOH77496.1 L-aspartate oxidase [Myxococcota bacterium]
MKTDCLVLGSGIGGLAFAIDASRTMEVVIATKRDANESNTRYAQGGVAGVMDSDDSFDMHAADTITAGAGLCHPETVDLVVRSAPSGIEWLIDSGVRFTEDHGRFDLTKEGGHSRRRVFHAGDITGIEIQRALLERARSIPNITFLENTMGVDLWLREDASGTRRVGGAFMLDRDRGRLLTVTADCIVLATGGAGKVYLYTSNPDVATGDGVAMAFRAGARISNMEFFQFHPTCLYHPRAKSFLLSEALRGEGGILRRVDGTPFMHDYHPLKELAPRDIVARAIDHEMKMSGHDHVLLDMTARSPDYIENRFPNLTATCRTFGYDLPTEPVPVVPAAHYMCGGVRTDLDGRTSIPGLFAVGEVACTGLHGANRLASNSLLEAVVFGRRAAAAVMECPDRVRTPDDAPDPPSWMRDTAVSSNVENVMVTQDWDEVRRLMWNYVGIVRSNRRLNAARRRLDLVSREIRDYYLQSPLTPDLVELRNIAGVANLIVRSALSRQETRGLHFNVDYPETDDRRCLHDTEIWLGVNTRVQKLGPTRGE